MCTVTILPRARLVTRGPSAEPLVLRVACNRDELVTRGAATPPAVHTIGGRRVLMPVDSESGGTWLAASDAGLVFALLNSTPGSQPPADGLTRGTIIPGIAHAGSVSEALASALDLRLERHRPFRLLIVDGYQLVECWLEEGRLRHRRAYLQGPVMRTSSSLGDVLVHGPRRTLFRQFFRAAADAQAAQDAFHDHQWPGREAVSVRMSRDGARTVSQAVVEITPNVAAMTYHAAGAARSVRVLLPLADPHVLAGIRRCS